MPYESLGAISTEIYWKNTWHNPKQFEFSAEILKRNTFLGKYEGIFEKFLPDWNGKNRRRILWEISRGIFKEIPRGSKPLNDLWIFFPKEKKMKNLTDFQNPLE